MTHKHRYILNRAEKCKLGMHEFVLDKNNLGKCKHCPATKQYPVEMIQKLRPSEVITIENLSSDSISDPDGWCYASVHGVKLDKDY